MLTFLGLSVLLILTPGPNQALLTSRVLSGGRRSGFAAVRGLAAGMAVHVASGGPDDWCAMFAPGLNERARCLRTDERDVHQRDEDGVEPRRVHGVQPRCHRGALAHRSGQDLGSGGSGSAGGAVG